MITFVLVRPQLGENIGMTARALWNCGFDRLVLVAPREGWSREAALACSAGAEHLIHSASIYPDLEAALNDYTAVYASTARPRDLDKPCLDLQSAATDVLGFAGNTEHRVAVLLGAERTGLTNADISLAHKIITIPLNPAYSSLNLSQAALLIAYALWQPSATPPVKERALAPLSDYNYLFKHLEESLDAARFWQVPEKKPRMVENLRALLLRAELSRQEIQTLHGVITALKTVKAD